MGKFVDTYTAYLVRQHAWRVALVAMLIVAIVTPIHVASYVELTWQQAQLHGRSGAWELARFVVFRATDVLTQVFPTSLMLGVLWSETAHSLSGRRLMAQVAGRSHDAQIRALLIVAAASVAVQFTLDNIARPHVILTMIEQRVGNYGEYVENDGQPLGSWVSTGDIVIQAREVDRERPAFRDVTVYRFGRANTLEEITAAAQLFPQDRAGGMWRLQEGFRIAFPGAAGSSTQDGRSPPAARHFSTEDISLPIDPLWLRYLGIGQGYIRFGDLIRLAASTGIPLDQPDYSTGLQIRLAKSVIPALLCIVAVATFLLVGSRHRLVAVAAGAALAATYVGTAVSKAIGALGQGQYLNGHIGAWLAPVLLALLAAFLVSWLMRAARLPRSYSPQRYAAGPQGNMPRDARAGQRQAAASGAAP